jgi:hypothetical protein
VDRTKNKSRDFLNDLTLSVNAKHEIRITNGMTGSRYRLDVRNLTLIRERRTNRHNR